MNQKMLETILRVVFFCLAAWGLWRVYTVFAGEGEVTVGALLFALMVLCVTGLYVFFGIMFDTVVPEKKRLIEAVLVSSLVLSFAATSSAATELDVPRAYSGLRLSKLIVDSLMAVAFYGLVIVIVERVSMMREKVLEQGAPEPVSGSSA